MEKLTLYLCVHKRLCDKVSLSGVMPKKDFFRIIGELYHIPKKFRIIVMREMEELEMIEDLGIKNNSNIKVNPLPEDFDEEMDKIYRESGLF